MTGAFNTRKIDHWNCTSFYDFVESPECHKEKTIFIVLECVSSLTIPFLIMKAVTKIKDI